MPEERFGHEAGSLILMCAWCSTIKPLASVRHSHHKPRGGVATL